MDTKTLKRRADKAFSDKEMFRDLYESAYEIALPQRNLFTDYSKGAKKMSGVYTSDGMEAVNTFVNIMQSTLTPSFTRWADIKAGTLIPEELEDSVNEMLEEVNKTVFGTIDASNFNTAIAEFYYDLSVGTGCMLVLEGATDENPIDFVTVPIAHVALEEGPSGTIDGIYRKHKLAGRLITEQWKDAKLPAKLTESIANKPEVEVELNEVTYKDYKTGKWCYEVFCDKYDDKIVERIIESNPWVIARWSKVAGEAYGRGPLLQALPDLKTLNILREYGLRAYALNAIGVYTVADEDAVNSNNIILEPGAFISVERNSGPNGPSIAALPQVGNFQIQEYEQQSLKDSINRLMLNNRLPSDAGPVRSATEIAERVKDNSVDIGAAYGRLVYELVQSLIKRIIDVMMSKGLITLDAKFSKIDNLFAKIIILSPAAKRQRYEDVQSVVQSLQILFGISPETAMTVFNMDKVGKYIAEQGGVPAQLLNNEEEAMQVKQQMQEAAAAAAQPKA